MNKHKTEDSPFAPQTVKVTDIATRLKILEERYVTLRKKTQLSEQNIIESDKEHSQEIRLLNDSLLELKKTLKDVLEKISMLGDEVNNFAPRTQMITLQRYMEFWQPMDFVTRKEVNTFLRKKFSDTPNPNQAPPKKVIKEDKPVSIEDAYPDID